MKYRRIVESIVYRIAYYLIIPTILVGSTSCRNEGSLGLTDIENMFEYIPDSVQTSVYWYWISDNLSKEGVIKDLEAMKAVGINRAFIGNIGLPPGDQPYGTVKIFTDEWWDILHTALKKATELNIEIGIFNSPGWSQSGGPWVKPEEAMRYLASSELVVKGPQTLKVKLPQPNDVFQDVKLLAYPFDEKATHTLNATNAKITSEPSVDNIAHIADGNMDTGVNFQSFGTVTVDFDSEEEQVIRSIMVSPLPHPIHVDVEFLVREKEGGYRSVKTFHVNRTNASLNVGFKPYGPVTVAVPETKGHSFRVVFTHANQHCNIGELTLTSQVLEERFVEKSLAKMFQTPLPYWHDYMWPVQPEATDKASVIRPEDIINITDYLAKDGYLQWEVPAGSWKIIRSGMTPTGTKNEPASEDAKGLEIDKMSRKHVATHFDAFMGEIIRRIPAEDRKTWKVVVQDSYEQGGQNWTDDFIADFEKCYGYNPVPFIPVFSGNVVGSRDITDRFLWDLRRLVADKVAYDYVGGLRDVSHKHGLTTWLENYGHWGFPGEFLQYGGQSDEIGGEFWSEGSLGDIENRAASSCGHIYGKRKISAESFTAAGAVFGRYPELMKQRGDRFFTEGINNTLLHVYIHQPYEDKNPGMNAWFGNEFNRKNTWFYDMDMFIDYLKRCNFMLQQGTYVADAAYFIGEDAPKMTGVCDPPLPKGYSFDYINSEVIMSRIQVKDGHLVLPDGLKYKVLVLPKQETMRPELLRRIIALVKDGAVVLGPAPMRSPSYQNYPNADNEVQELAKELWGTVDGTSVKYRRVGKGLIASGMEMQELFDLVGLIPDFEVNNNDPLLFIHRTLKDGEMYFVSNQANHPVEVSPSFRINGKSPELWDAVTGKKRALEAYYQKEGATFVPLKLEALESAFIVFRNSTNDSPGGSVADNYPVAEPIKSIDTPWTVTFDARFGGLSRPVVMDTLYDWTQSANDSIKYYSGTAVYANQFVLDEVSKDKTYYIDLGKVMVMAKVSINGKYADGVWTAPWRVDISDFIKPGNNTVEISVVNNWMNRLIGDSTLPEQERRTWTPVNPYHSGSELQSSGLQGPVRILQ